MMRIKNNNDDEIITEPVSEEQQPSPIVRGSRVKFTGTKSYSGLDISQYQNKEYKVKELSEDRIVLAEGTNVIAAVNIKDCIKI